MNCYVCGEECKSWSELMCHKKHVHDSDVISKPPYDIVKMEMNCYVCGKGYK